ncbi:Asp23/Gls24 family envelope stress response protein [Tannockella kyphosi]|uniref:Asp23/Gls24 family envelope stress response protein n=1 Tax=Tannockella kyphosi TaxID=2899121 RepID=UPI002012E00E|nr:Asp23/Gls24 family envelope stress response protein [Tannockella kyphosi]
MSQEHYVLEEKTNLGSASVCMQVFEGIAYAAIKRAEGIELDAPSGIKISGRSPINAKIADESIIIDVDACVDYGVNVASTTQDLQTAIMDKVKQMTELTNCRVNIYIRAIHF